MTTDVPASVEDLTPAWLGEVLHEAGSIGLPRPVPFRAERLGLDRGTTSELLRLVLAPERAGSAGDPCARSLVVKMGGSAHSRERRAREAAFYRELGSQAGVTTPRALWTGAGSPGGGVVILLEWIEGRCGDAALGCSPEEALAVVRAMARMHATWHRDARLARLEWLPRWGRGEADSRDPHRRRAERYRKRLGPFLDRYGGAVPAALRAVLTRLANELESVLAEAAAVPPTLIHGDLHLDNVIFRGEGARPEVVVLDWQSVSAGPGTHDLARFVGESIRGAGAAASAIGLVEAYRDALVEAGCAEAARCVLDELPPMLLCVMAGLVSGTPAGGARAERTIRRAVSEEGLGGVVPALEQRRARASQ